MPLAIKTLYAWRIPLTAMTGEPLVPATRAPESIEAPLFAIRIPRPQIKNALAVQIAGLRPFLDGITMGSNISVWSPRQGDGHYARLIE